MLPNRKLNRSRENPPDRLIRTIPTASPDESKIATDESGGILIESVIFVIPSAAIIVKAYAVHIGYKLRNSPIDNPPKATCDMASPNNECFLSTRNKPIAEHIAATAMPEINARCINPNSRISKMVMSLNLRPFRRMEAADDWNWRRIDGALNASA